MKLFGWTIGSRRPALAWWSPHWSNVPETWRMWRPMFSLGFLCRVTLVSVPIIALLIAACKIAFPLLQVDFLWRMALVIPLLPAFFFFICLVHLAIPKHVEVRPDRIHIMHGDYHWLANSAEIESTRIVIFAPDRIRLRITYLRKGRRQQKAVGVGNNVDLEKLSQLLPVPPQTWDARKRFERLRRAGT